MAYLKYYLERRNNRLYLNSIVCEENKEIIEPENFVKWFNKDEWKFVPARGYENCVESVMHSIWNGHLEPVNKP